MSDPKPLNAKETLEELEEAIKEHDALRKEYRRFEMKSGAARRDFEDTIRYLLERLKGKA